MDQASCTDVLTSLPGIRLSQHRSTAIWLESFRSPSIVPFHSVAGTV